MKPKRLRDDPRWMREVRRLRKRGLSYKAIAASVLTDCATVYYALNPRDTPDGRPSQAGRTRGPRPQAQRDAARYARLAEARALAADAERIRVLQEIVAVDGLRAAARLEGIPAPVLRAALEMAS